MVAIASSYIRAKTLPKFFHIARLFPCRSFGDVHHNNRFRLVLKDQNIYLLRRFDKLSRCLCAVCLNHLRVDIDRMEIGFLAYSKNNSSTYAIGKGGNGISH